MAARRSSPRRAATSKDRPQDLRGLLDLVGDGYSLYLYLRL
jgi:hypothetical protein